MVRRLIACALLVWYLPACMTWRVSANPNVKELIATEQPAAVRVTLTSGAEIVLRQPSISGDSLSGVHHPRVAISDVRQVAIRKESDTKTAALCLGIVSAFAIFAVVRINADK